MRRLLAGVAGAALLATMVVGPARAATTQAVVGIGSAAVVTYTGTPPAPHASQPGTAVFATSSTEGGGVVSVGLKIRLVACAAVFRAPWVDNGMYIRTIGVQGRDFRILTFHASANNGAYKAGTTYTIVEDTPVGVGGNDAVCKFRSLPGGIVNPSHAASNGTIVFLPPGAGTLPSTG